MKTKECILKSNQAHKWVDEDTTLGAEHRWLDKKIYKVMNKNIVYGDYIMYDIKKESVS